MESPNEQRLAQLLFGEEVYGAGIAFGRLLGIALLAFSIACWPGADSLHVERAALFAILLYNLAAALYLAYLGADERQGGILLWPAVAEHGLVAHVLRNGWRHSKRAARDGLSWL